MAIVSQAEEETIAQARGERPLDLIAVVPDNSRYDAASVVVYGSGLCRVTFFVRGAEEPADLILELFGKCQLGFAGDFAYPCTKSPLDPRVEGVFFVDGKLRIDFLR